MIVKRNYNFQKQFDICHVLGFKNITSVEI